MSSAFTPPGASGSLPPDACPVTVVTRMRIPATPEAVWRGLMFFEEIEEPPPLLLRLLLPLPQGTRGTKAAVGDEALCVYERGHLRKRVMHIEPGSRYGFEVTEQQLGIGGGLRLRGGSYELHALADGGTELAVTTHYLPRRHLAWLLRPVEAAVCHMFHRHLLGAIRRKVERG